MTLPPDSPPANRRTFHGLTQPAGLRPRYQRKGAPDMFNKILDVFLSLVVLFNFLALGAFLLMV